LPRVRQTPSKFSHLTGHATRGIGKTVKLQPYGRSLEPVLGKDQPVRCRVLLMNTLFRGRTRVGRLPCASHCCPTAWCPYFRSSIALLSNARACSGVRFPKATSSSCLSSWSPRCIPWKPGTCKFKLGRYPRTSDELYLPTRWSRGATKFGPIWQRG